MNKLPSAYYLLAFPSVKVIIRSTGRFTNFSVAPLGHRMVMASTLVAAPRPKCSRQSECEI